MKKDIFKYILVMFLGVSLVACEDYDPEINYYDTAKLDLSATKFTVLDSELATTIDFVTTTKTVTNVRLVYDGNEINTGTAANNKYSVTLKRSDLELSEIGDASRLYVYATVDGKEKEMYTTIKMVSATSIDNPVDEDGDEVAVYELSDVVKNFTYKVSPKTSTAIIVEPFIKVGEMATFASLGSKAYDADNLNIPIKGSDYTKNDTVFVQLIAKVGTFTDTVSTSIIISEYLLGDSKSINVNVEKPGYDLVGDSIIDIAETACTVKFTHDFASLEQGLETMNSTSLVAISDEALEELMGNLPVLKAAFDAGTPMTVVSDVTVGDSYLIKHSRGGKDYYGTLVITSKNDNRTGADDYVSFDVAFEEYDVQK
ncbi:hypothetical protein EO244_10075 [Ancylomarina salipaludis]|uniref:Uncharacterized protein n=1 Tax=Ancylomarina salipaludis TaxID=2501299 RepID=A0A4Q1JLS7_9BACT|nr:hypothetical protein [Ancylomarina salipaludis]RXQ93914.1 hypothetical protein EO244_10075 [Ancylomarina salipaludis]